jgi:hypothetical protein
LGYSTRHHRPGCPEHIVMSTAPLLKTSSVRIAYTSTDGYRAEAAFSSRRAASPQAGMLDAIDEMARILALFGFAGEARAVVSDACDRVKADREAKATGAQS